MPQAGGRPTRLPTPHFRHQPPAQVPPELCLRFRKTNGLQIEVPTDPLQLGMLTESRLLSVLLTGWL